MSQRSIFIGRCSYPAWRGMNWYTTYGLSEESVRAKNPNATEIKISTMEIDSENPVLSIPYNSQFVDYTNEFVFVGEPVDSRCSPIGIRYITHPELREVANRWWEEQKKQQRASSDAYYSQKWV